MNQTIKYERQNYIQENILIAILLRYPRHYQVLIRYCFDLVYIMLIHSFIHSIVEFVQKLNKLQCTKTKRFDFNRFKNIIYPKIQIRMLRMKNELEHLHTCNAEKPQ